MPDTPPDLHTAGSESMQALGRRVTAFIESRLAATPLGRQATPREMRGLLTGAISESGMGLDAAWDLFTESVAPNNIGLGSERFLAFVPVSPSAAGVWMDAAVSAGNFSAESWLEASGAVAAENQVLDWLAGVIGLPAGAGGCFMSGGSIGNLSALAVARDQSGGRRGVAIADSAHASVGNALHLLGLDAVTIPTEADGRYTAEAFARAVGDRRDIGVVCAAGGSTNAGVVDDLAGLADICTERSIWLHVDAAYGGAALLAETARPLFAGIERADSVIIDPHKWLFGPAGSCALLYRRPELAAAVHTQRGPYIDVLHDDDDDGDVRAAVASRRWNPSDYGFQLTRRACGLPLWFALVGHGVEAHRVAIEKSLSITQRCAAKFAELPLVELVTQPQLGVVLFRRLGWGHEEWRTWASELLDAGVAFVAPTTWRGEPVGRLVFMHPNTPDSIIAELADSLC